MVHLDHSHKLICEPKVGSLGKAMGTSATALCQRWSL